MSHQTCLPDDKGDNEGKSEAEHRSPDICLTAEGKARKTPAWGPLESCMTSPRLKWDPLTPNEVGMIAKLVLKKEGREEISPGEKGLMSIEPWLRPEELYGSVAVILKLLSGFLAYGPTSVG